MRKCYKILPLNQNKDLPDKKNDYSISSKTFYQSVAVLRDTDDLPWIFLHLPQIFISNVKARLGLIVNVEKKKSPTAMHACTPKKERKRKTLCLQIESEYHT